MIIWSHKPDKQDLEILKSRGAGYVLDSALEYSRSANDLWKISHKSLSFFVYLLEKKYSKEKKPYRVKITYIGATCYFNVEEKYVDLYKIVFKERDPHFNWTNKIGVEIKLLAKNKYSGEKLKGKRKKKKKGGIKK